jgi:hypothetical protein
MTLLLTWTDIWLFIGRVFQWLFKLMPPMGFTVNLMVWLIISFWFFYWLWKQAQDTKKAKAEGRLI